MACGGWPAICIKKKTLCIWVIFFLNFYMNVTKSYISGKYNFYVFLNVLKFENTSCMSKYEYEYHDNVELSIYYSTLQSFCLIL